jgi:hypothetical protein
MDEDPDMPILVAMQLISNWATRMWWINNDLVTTADSAGAIRMYIAGAFACQVETSDPIYQEILRTRVELA